MSDVAQGPDWWLASDGKWYPPQQQAAAAPPPPPQYAPPQYAPPAYQPPPAAYAPAVPMPDAKSQGIVLLAGAAAVIVAAFLPWASVDFLGESISKAGTDGDGVITVVFGIAAAVFGFLALGAARRRWHAITALVLAALVVIIAVIDIADIKSRFGDGTSGIDVEVTIGIGLWLTLAGGLAAAVGAVLVLTRTPKAARAA
jgi:hypothetical protein